MIETEKPETRKGSLGWAVFLVIAASAWAVTIWQMAEMSKGMMVPIHVFITTWIVMMAAMMLPSVAPVALMWARSIKSSSSGGVRLVRNSFFVAGYLVVWGAFGLIAYVGSMGIAALSEKYPDHSKWFVAGLFVIAGVYQLTPLKDVCLKHCRSPMSQLLAYAALKGPAVDLRVGMHHGMYCVGCCWGIMLVLLALGLMNLAAAGALAIVIFVEKIWSRGHFASKAFGLLLIGAGMLSVPISAVDPE